MIKNGYSLTQFALLGFIEREPVGMSGSLHYKNPIAQKAHELIGVPYQANSVYEVLTNLQTSSVGITLVELSTGEVLYGIVNDEIHVPTSNTLTELWTTEGIKTASFFRNGYSK